MSRYSIYATPIFKRIYFSLDKSERDWIDKMRENFKENPAGRPLKFNWFREKRYLGKSQNEFSLLFRFPSRKSK